MGALFIAWPQKKKINNERTKRSKLLNNEAKNFFQKSKKAIKKFNEVLSFSLKQKKTIGFYMPLRAFPYIASFNNYFKYRLFDDQKHWHKKYIDGETTKIENYGDLLKNPVDHLFIMSLTFGATVKKKIIKKLPKTKITLIRDLLE